MLAQPIDLDLLLDRALQTGGETRAFDFKETLDYQKNGEHKIKLLKAIGSFYNTEDGGHIIIGVTNARRVVGILPELAATYDQTPVQRTAGEYFAPQPTVQVRHHQRDGMHLVLIEVKPFDDIPCIVKKYEVQGKETLRDGTFLTRNGAAESALLTTESDLRKLCDAVARRRAGSIADILQKLAPNSSSAAPPDPFRTNLLVIKAEADRMTQHATALNASLSVGGDKSSLSWLLPRRFQLGIIEGVLPHVLGQIDAKEPLVTELAELRSAAAAADREAERLLASGGNAQRLQPLVRSVLSSSRNVSTAVGWKLR